MSSISIKPLSTVRTTPSSATVNSSSSTTHTTPSAPSCASSGSFLSSYIRPILFGGGFLLASALFYRLYRSSSSSSSASKKTPILTPNVRSFFQSYWSSTHPSSPPLTDAAILSRICSAYDLSMRSFPYRCIREYRFIEARAPQHPDYASLISQNANRNDLCVLDVGCCMGTDLRQLVLDGIRRENVMGVDMEKQFFEAGFQMFQDRSSWPDTSEGEEESMGPFVSYNLLSTGCPLPSRLHRFISTRGLDVIYCGSVFHLLQEDETYRFALALSDLFALSKSIRGSKRGEGGVLIGRAVGSSHPEQPLRHAESGQLRYLHSIKTMKIMLEKAGFRDVRVSLGEIDMPSARDDASSETENVKVVEIDKMNSPQKERLKWNGQVTKEDLSPFPTMLKGKGAMLSFYANYP